MQGEMTLTEIKRAFAELDIAEDDMGLLIEYIEQYKTCPVCGRPLYIKPE